MPYDKRYRVGMTAHEALSKGLFVPRGVRGESKLEEDDEGCWWCWESEPVNGGHLSERVNATSMSIGVLR